MGLQRLWRLMLWLLVASLLACEAEQSPTKKQNIWAPVSEEVIVVLDKAWVMAYEESKGDEADALVLECYYATFEPAERNMEAAIKRYISGQRAAKLEDDFNQFRRALREAKPRGLTKKKLEGLRRTLRLYGQRLDTMGVTPAHLKGRK